MGERFIRSRNEPVEVICFSEAHRDWKHSLMLCSRIRRFHERNNCRNYFPVQRPQLCRVVDDYRNRVCDFSSRRDRFAALVIHVTARLSRLGRLMFEAVAEIAAISMRSLTFVTLIQML